MIDQIYRGGDVTMDFTCIEYKAGPLKAATLFGDAMGVTGAQYLEMPIRGRIATALASILILTSTTGTPAVSSPATLTANNAMIHEGFDVNWMYNSKLRTVPIKFRLLPYLDTQIKYFTAT